MTKHLLTALLITAILPLSFISKSPGSIRQIELKFADVSVTAYYIETNGCVHTFQDVDSGNYYFLGDSTGAYLFAIGRCYNITFNTITDNSNPCYNNDIEYVIPCEAGGK